MKADSAALKVVLIAVIFILFLFGSSSAKEIDCLNCHKELKKQKTVHPALDMGCTACHVGIDATDIPHKKTNGIAKGLSAEQPDLCYGCHDKAAFTKKNVHAALGMGCTTCHNPHSSKNKKLLVDSPPKLCFKCHDKALFNNKYKHSPVKKGKCTFCHDPHSSDEGKLLTSGTPDLCFKCHDKTIFARKSQHSPVAAGMCTSCHNPHSAGNEKLLVSEPPDLCFSCHDKEIAGRRVVHPPVSGGMCLSCHDPHSSDSEGKLLVQDVPGLCFTCHEKDNFMGKEDVHPPVAAGMCTTCHRPHSSDSLKLLTAGIPDLCYECHDLKSELREKTWRIKRHGPVKIGMCMSCHKPHQADKPKLLIKEPPALCFDCHQDDDFNKRDVHPPVAEGMCLQCHSTHLAGNSKLLQMDGNGVCMQCHEDLTKGPHPVTAYTTGGHPLSGKWGKWDRRHPWRPFGCVSCHTPHSSDYGRLFRYPVSDTFALCKYCHKEM